MHEQYLNDFDVTKSIQVSDPEAVKSEVLSIFSLGCPNIDAIAVEKAFDLFTKLYNGTLPGYLPCDALYHDIQHSLDITLTTARLLRGYQKVHGALNEDHILLGIVTALFHDAGYVRESDNGSIINGAEYTRIHVSRGADFMLKNLPAIGLEEIAKRAAQIVHLTGYEITPELIQPDIPLDRLIGDMVATADLITQMADRCYLEKCRDRLFPELALAAKTDQHNESPLPIYQTAQQLLFNTPEFYRLHVRKRLEFHFKSVFRYASAYFNGPNYYMLGIENNVKYLERLIDNIQLELLRRDLPKNYGEKVFPYELLNALINPERHFQQASP